jgi:hypothetical protein
MQEFQSLRWTNDDDLTCKIVNSGFIMNTAGH